MLTPSTLPSRAFWKGRRVFLTGHTGFKGSWLALWLQGLGAEVTGYALRAQTEPALFEVARVAEGMTSKFGDVRDLESVTSAMQAGRPEIVLHLAAQPLVRASYVDPVATYSTNVMGTVHVLEAARSVPGLRALVNVTTDKCYENREWVWGYREDEPMGGFDPYSNSKGCSELVTAAYRRSFFSNGDAALGSARAGNVIGGGDWAPDRLVPDILRAFSTGSTVSIRNPASTRPWQHVLEPLSGYLVLAERLFQDRQAVAEGFNFGPKDDDAKPVKWIVERLVERWGGNAHWEIDERAHHHEAAQLKLDISKARERLSWQPRWDLGTALDAVVEWHQAWLARADMRSMCLQQIAQFEQDHATLKKESA